MRASTQRTAYFLRKSTDISALAAMHQNFNVQAVKFQQFQTVDGNLARRPIQLDSLPRIFVQRLAIALERRMHRRNLLDLASKLRERSEEHTSELQSLMRTSYAVFCLKKKTNKK